MIQALQAQIIVKPEEKPTETSSGIQVVGDLRPEGALRRGTVISVGSQVKGIEPGDKVGFTDHSGVAFEYNGERYINMYYVEALGTY